MAKKKKQVDTLVNDWMDKIKSGKSYRSKFSSYKKWPDYRKMYRGQWADGLVPVNRIFSYGRTLVPRVYFRSPRVCITPTRPDLVWHAKVVEELDNQLIRETLLKEALKRASLDGFLCGTGPIKIGYDSEFGYLPEQTVGEEGSTVTQTGRKTGTKIEYREGVQPGMPWALRVSPDDVVVPWGSSEASSLPWIAHYILRPLEDIKEDQKYRNTKDLKGTRSPDQSGRRQSGFKPTQKKDKDVLYGELWEVRDLKTGKLMVFCEDEMILSEEDVLQIEGLPWEFIQFNPDPEFFWAIADATILEPQQHELNDVRTQSSRHRQIALLKFLYRREAIKAEELQKFFSGEVGPGVAVDDDTLANAIVTLQPHMPPELWKEAQMILQDMREELGFTSNQLGEFSPKHGTTAREVGVVESAFDFRVDERKDIVADVLTRIVRKWNQFIFSFWSEEKVVQITSPQGTPFWIKYTGDQLKGEYFLNVDPESGMPLSRMLKYQMARELFGLLNGDRAIDQVMLRQILLQHYTAVEPLAARLISSAVSINVQEEAASRQPNPIFGDGAGSSRQKPMELDEARKKLGSMRR